MPESPASARAPPTADRRASPARASSRDERIAGRAEPSPARPRLWPAENRRPRSIQPTTRGEHATPSHQITSHAQPVEANHQVFGLDRTATFRIAAQRRQKNTRERERRQHDPPIDVGEREHDRPLTENRPAHLADHDHDRQARRQTKNRQTTSRARRGHIPRRSHPTDHRSPAREV